jgi:3-hydroxyisobutyrate dehydrogenase-like beta-hydroxyacid dehydrogenase
MGSPMVDRMLAAGLPVTVHARRPEVRERFAAAGAAVTDSPAVVAAAADIVIVCVYSDDQLLDLALGDDGLVANMEPGSVLALHTTGSPSTARTVAEAGAARDVHIVDAPVSGTGAGIAQGKLTVMLGGESADRDRVRAVVATYSDHVFDTGALGTAQCVKLVNNAVLAANLQIACDAERIARELGIELTALAAVLHVSSGQSFALDMMAGLGGTEKAVGLAGHFLRKDVDAVKEAAAELGLDLGLLGQVADGPIHWEGRD